MFWVSFLYFVPLLIQLLDYFENALRGLCNNAPHDEKTFSVYKPYTEWINKGKAGVPVELGVKVCVMEDQLGFIINHRVMYKETDDKIAVEF